MEVTQQLWVRRIIGVGILGYRLQLWAGLLCAGYIWIWYQKCHCTRRHIVSINSGLSLAVPVAIECFCNIAILKLAWVVKLQGGSQLFFSGRGVRPGFPKCGAWELQKFSNLGAWELKFGQKLEAVEAKIWKFFSKVGLVNWLLSSATWNGTLANYGSLHGCTSPYPLSRSVPPLPGHMLKPALVLWILQNAARPTAALCHLSLTKMATLWIESVNIGQTISSCSHKSTYSKT